MKYCNVDYGLEEYRYARWYEQSTRETAALLEKRDLDKKTTTLSKELMDKWAPYLDMDFRPKRKPISRQIPADGGIVELTKSVCGLDAEAELSKILSEEIRKEQLNMTYGQLSEGEKERRKTVEQEMIEANAMLRARGEAREYAKLAKQYIDQAKQANEIQIHKHFRNPSPVQIADGAITGIVPGEMNVIASGKDVGKYLTGVAKKVPGEPSFTILDLVEMIGTKNDKPVVL